LRFRSGHRWRFSLVASVDCRRTTYCDGKPAGLNYAYRNFWRGVEVMGQQTGIEQGKLGRVAKPVGDLLGAPTGIRVGDLTNRLVVGAEIGQFANVLAPSGPMTVANGIVVPTDDPDDTTILAAEK
jgi:hypothetical protein